MSDFYLGQIMLFGGTYAPSGWALCQGQLMAISQNTALFSLLGTNYGGDGRSTFGLPNLQGIVAYGSGPNNGVGSMDGTATVTLDASQLALHNHQLIATTTTGGSVTAAGHLLAATGIAERTGQKTGVTRYSAASPAQTLAPQSIVSAGGGGAHNNMQPYLALVYCIATTGIFPQRP